MMPVPTASQRQRNCKREYPKVTLKCSPSMPVLRIPSPQNRRHGCLAMPLPLPLSVSVSIPVPASCPTPGPTPVSCPTLDQTPNQTPDQTPNPIPVSVPNPVPAPDQSPEQIPPSPARQKLPMYPAVHKGPPVRHTGMSRTHAKAPLPP